MKNLYLLFLATAASLASSAESPIRLCTENPRYFEWEGKATVLVTSGEHYGSVINPDFDFVRYLASLQAAGLNHTRLFLGDYAEGPDSFGIVENPLAPAPGRFLAPWARSGIPGFARGGNKFDLDHWNPAYFERLHAFFQEAGRRGIVVEAVLFFVGPGYEFAPLNPSNNVNSTTPIDAVLYLSLDNGNVLSRQEQYTRKIVGELNRYPNLIFNLCNEPWFNNQEQPGFASQPPAATKAWIERVSEWVSDEETRLPSRHLLSVDLTNQGSPITQSDLSGYFAKISVFNVHYDANGQILQSNPSLPRLLAFNETGFNGAGDDFYRTQGWNFMLSGGGLYGNLDFSFVVGHEDGSGTPGFTGSYNAGGGPAIRGQMKVLLDFMRALPLRAMKPDNGVVVGGADSWRALAGPGEAYAVWFPGEGPISPQVAVPKGQWRADWVDILTGAVTSEAFTPTTWITTLKGVRHGGGAALRIVRSGTGPNSLTSGSQGDSAAAPSVGAGSTAQPIGFDQLADTALAQMVKRANELKIGGVAVVAYFQGDTIRSWSSKMVVVGRMKDAPGAGNYGNNLLGIAYGKASEMADTLRNSGSGTRPTMVGEYGWRGGMIAQTKTGYAIAAFSGGKDPDDLEVSRTGLEVLKSAL